MPCYVKDIETSFNTFGQILDIKRFIKNLKQERGLLVDILKDVDTRIKDLLIKLLCFNAEERISCEEILAHEAFDIIQEQFVLSELSQYSFE